LKAGTALGNQAKGFMDRGELVPDSVTNEMVKDRLTHDDAVNGFLLDGFPRNVAQAEVLREILADKKTPLHAVLEFSLANEEIVARLSARRTCRDCGAPSVGVDKCPTCGGDVYQREDDKAEVITRRLEVYAEQTAPIISFYRNEGLLISVSAVGKVEDITAHAISALSRVAQ
jgi:adenylate kinase